MITKKPDSMRALLVSCVFVIVLKYLLDILDLFIEYRLQMPVIAGFLVMRFLSGYTLVYTVF
jgi:hypothetical protein